MRLPRRRVTARSARPSASRRRIIVQKRSDSAQLHDSPELAFFLERFPKSYHEPYYKSYLRDPLEGILGDAGFVGVGTAPSFVAKVAWGRKRGG